MGTFVGLLAVAAVVGCRHQAPPPTADPLPVRIGIHTDPLSLDPHLQNEMLSYAVLFNVVETLTAFDREARVGPALASSWENPDELTWRFHLRPDVRFHDGSLLDAADVVFSFDRARHHPGTQMGSILVSVADVSEVDEHTVEITTERPVPVLLNKLAFIAILPVGTPATIDHPIGTGPYRLESYRPGEQMHLVAFDGYWGGPPTTPSVTFRPIESRDARVDALLAGELDLIHDVPGTAAPAIDRVEGISVRSVSGFDVQYLHLMVDVPPFDDLRVRQAIDLALDREELVEQVLGGYGQPVGQLVSPNVFGFDPNLTPVLPDHHAARRLLAAAGYPNGFAIRLEMRRGRDADLLVEQLARVGVTIEVVERPWREIWDRLGDGLIPFYLGIVLAPSADASDVLDGFVHTLDQERGYGLTNFPRYSDPELDRLIEQSASTMDLLPRRQQLQEGMRRLSEGLAYIPLFVRADIYAASDALEWQPRTDSLLLAKEMTRRQD